MTSEIKELEDSINTALKNLENEVKKLENTDYNQKQAAIKKCGTLVKSITALVDSFELELSGLDKAEADEHQDILKNINVRFGQLKNDFESKKTDSSAQQDLFGNRKKKEDKRLSQMNRNYF